MVSKLISYFLFPVLLISIVWVSIYTLFSGVSANILIPCVTIFVAVFVLLLERAYPYLPDWNLSKGDVKTDILHAIFSTGLIAELNKWLFFGLFAQLSIYLSSLFYINLWPSSWPIVAQLILALLIGEFGQYWVHRLSHEKKLFWRFHATHHSAERLYWLNAGRFHPLDTMLQHFFEFIPLILLGAGPEILALFAIVTVTIGFLQHANVTIKLGPLNWIFSVSELHRWHHATSEEGRNKNYGSNLIIWDIIFKTRFLPEDGRMPTSIGLLNMPSFPKKFLEQLVSPVLFQQYNVKEVSSSSDSLQKYIHKEM